MCRDYFEHTKRHKASTWKIKKSHNGADLRREQLYLLLWMEINAPLWRRCWSVLDIWRRWRFFTRKYTEETELSGACVRGTAAGERGRERELPVDVREPVRNRLVLVYCKSRSPFEYSEKYTTVNLQDEHSHILYCSFFVVSCETL